MDIGLLNYGKEGFFRSPARLKQAGKAAALSQFWDFQLQRSDPGIPWSLPVAIAIGRPVFVSFIALGADLCGNFSFHQGLDQNLKCFSQEVDVTIKNV